MDQELYYLSTSTYINVTHILSFFATCLVYGFALLWSPIGVLIKVVKIKMADKNEKMEIHILCLLDHIK